MTKRIYGAMPPTPSVIGKTAAELANANRCLDCQSAEAQMCMCGEYRCGPCQNKHYVIHLD
jgi:hypothetical protein